MLFQRILSLAVSVVLLQICSSIASSQVAGMAQNGEPVFDIPRVASITIDGQLDDWQASGFVVSGMGLSKATPWPRLVPAPSCRIGWNQDGIVVGIRVVTSSLHEHDYVRHLFKGDSVEFFISPQKGSRERYMLLLSPGLDPRFPKMRHCFFPDPSEEGEKDMDSFTFHAACVPTDNGYTMEVLLPWRNLPMVNQQIGSQLALQIYVTETDENGKCMTAMWHPAGESHIDPSAVYHIRLAEKPSPTSPAIAAIQDDAMRNTRPLRILGNASLADKNIEVRMDGGVVVGAMAAKGEQSFAMFDLPQGASPTVYIDNKPVPLVQLPPENDVATVLSEKLKCTFKSYVFVGEQFPSPIVEGARGYKINQTTFYDATFKPVEKPRVPGRYGAVIEIADRKGKISKRFRTLVRVPDRLGAWSAEHGNLSLLLRQLVDNPAYASLLNPSGKSGAESLEWLNDDSAINRIDTVVLLAYCMEQTPLSVGDALTNAQTADRQWWLNFKRRLYGWDQTYTQSFVCPKPINGPPARMLREGTCKDADIKPDVVSTIDDICSQTVKLSNEPVGILFARHGIIFFQKAYGYLPSGQPMTLQTPGDMQSSTKPLGGALMMMLVDQGVVKLDDPIDKYLPTFKGISVKQPVLIRHLFTHTSGLNGHWGDSLHDTEEIVSGYYHTLNVGNYGYNSLGFALGGKMIEGITDEALPIFAKKHLLDPLGMEHSEVTCAAKLAKSIPSEYARFAQMLLNRGAYGNMRFFSEKTFEKMLSPSIASARGIGLQWLSGDQISNGSFGHSAGNSSQIRMDPKNDLIFVACSAGTQKDFRTCYSVIYKAVLDGITDK